MKILYTGMAIISAIGTAGMAPAGVTLTEAVHLPKGEDCPIAHCKISGIMAERIGMDGHDYALRFELRLPDAFDGNLSGYPGFDLPRTGIQSALDIQTFRSVG